MRLRALMALACLAGCGEKTQVVNLAPRAILPPDLTLRPNVEVALSGKDSEDLDGEIVGYAWDFGDGASAEGAIVRHAWVEERVYAVTLTVTDDQGATGSGAMRVTVNATGVETNEAPVAVITGPGRGMPGVALSFTGAMSTDDGRIVEHRWTFGDGGTATGEVVEHTFAAAGTYDVALVVEDDRGALGQASRTVLITTTPDNLPPVAVAGPDQTADVGMPLTFDGRGSTDPDGSIVAYRWDLGDGSQAVETPQVSHAYARAGTFLVTLTVEDDAGATATDDLTVLVRPPPDYDGTWLLNPDMASQTCTNPRRNYQIVFPAARLAVLGSLTESVSAEVVGEGRVMSGAIDRMAAPPELTLAWTGSETEATCGTAMVRHRLRASLPDSMTMAGQLTVIYDWSEPRCNCARTFEITGARQ